MKITIYFCLFILLLGSCKKQLPFYGISEEMKAYFVFQKGSYWIYKNDSTGKLDSTFIKSIYSTMDNTDYSGIKRELIALFFRSTFLSDFEIAYFCPGPNCLTIASRLEYPNDTTKIETGGPLAYYSGYQPNTNIISQECIPGDVFTYRIIPSDTINNVIYTNIIYTKIQTINSDSTFPFFYRREIYFVKNIGIIKYLEISNYSNFQKSLSLLRENIIQ